MKKTAVIYWSGTGNTKQMAEAVLEGMKNAGAEAVLLEPAQVDASTFSGVDAVAFGCPAMGSEVLEEMETNVIHTAGIPTLLAHPEYQSLERAEPLMNFLSEMGESDNLPVVQNEHVKILIGPENVADELKDSSVIMASYDIGGGMQGVIGVVGPTRMDYADLAARLSYFAEGLSRMFGKGEIPPPGAEPKLGPPKPPQED